MIRFAKSLKAWGTSNFEGVLKSEVEQIEADLLPLQQGLALSNSVTDSPHKATIINVSDDEGFLRVKVGIFYCGIISGCSCADDPTPISEQTEYCEVLFAIDKLTAETKVELLRE